MPRSLRSTRLDCESLEVRANPIAVPPDFQVVPVVTEGLDFVTAITVAPDGRIFVAEKDGDLRVIEGGELLPDPAISLAVDTVADRGLLGVAFDPAFVDNQFVYVYYSTQDTGSGVESVVSRFTMSGNTIDPATERVFLRIPMPGAYHVAGMVQFGLDGKLYVSVGDNGNFEDCQKIDNLYGKILRFNPDGSIPTDNPFYNTAVGQNRAIWALGFRNPFSFSFQPGTGRLFVNDVGQNTWEEINDVIAGGNYGWPRKEGPDGIDNPDFIDPIYYYGHPATPNETSEGIGNAITSGAFYNPGVPLFPDTYVGKYFYADLNAGWIRVFDPATGESSPFAQGITDGTIHGALLGLVVDSDGSLLYSAIGRGMPQSIYKVTYVPPATPPVITLQPTNRSASIGQAVTFTTAAAGTEPLRFQWQRDGRDIPGATAPSYTFPNPGPADDGSVFRVVVTNDQGAVTSRGATLRVLDNTAPTAVITVPGETDTFGLGRTYTFQGTATDPEQGTLPPSAYKWEVFFVTGGVERPTFSQAGVSEGTFTLPHKTVYDQVDVELRIILTVTDEFGANTTTSVTLVPEIAPITIDTNIPGLAATTLGGQPFSGNTEGLVGFIRAVGALPDVTRDGARYRFVGWSDGGELVHDVETPPEGFTLWANYRRVDPIVFGSGPGGRPVVRIQQVDTDAVSTLVVFESDFSGGVRVATGDVNGDGIPDIIAAAGPGGGPRVRVFDGRDLSELASFYAFEESFQGGVFVSVADVDQDGTHDLILSPDVGGGARVRILSAGDPNAVLADFLGIDDPNYRGGVSTSVGDLNGDGVPDLVVGAAADGPRVAVYDGSQLLASWAESVPPRLVPDFFAFEETLRGGVSTAVGDVNGDGFADLVIGPGRTGGPRVVAIDGRGFAEGDGSSRVLADFFAGDAVGRDGVRLAVKDVDGDDTLGLIATGQSSPGPINVYRWDQESSGFGETPARVLDSFEGAGSGVFVG